MADLLKDDKLQGNGDPNSQGTQTSSDASALSGGGSNDVGSGQASTAGIGPGGQGAWTNIQAYLGANKGDTGSSTLLDNTVGSQFDKEKQNMTDDSNKYVNDAQTQVDKNKMTTDTADQNLANASKVYNYSGPQSDDYNNVVNSMQSYLKGSYNGPSAYSYTTSADTQNYGANLANQGGFDNMMSGIYSKAAGNPLTGGQYNLQKQFDVNNPNLENARQNLLTKYAGLNNDRDNLITATDSRLGDLAKQDRTNRSALSDYLSGKSNDVDTTERQAEIDARANYNNLYKNEGTGVKGIYDDGHIGTTAMRIRNMGQGSENWSPEQLTNERNRIANGMQTAPSNQAEYYNYYYNPVLSNIDNAISNWNTAKDAQFTNTGDDQKRQWNAIQDFLGSSADKKSQGFHVRG